MQSCKVTTRRGFLGQGLGLVGVGAVLPNFLVHTALAAGASPAKDRILVVLLLSGGQDGPSCIVPHSHESYTKKRKLTLIRPEDVLKLNDDVGLNPKLTGLKELYDQKHLAVINGVGYPNPNYSHFESMDIWQAADLRGKKAGTGWLGRYCDLAYRGVAEPALSLAVGEGVAPFAISGKEHPGLSFHRPEAFRYRGHRNNQAREHLYAALNRDTAASNNVLQFVTRTATGANAASERIRDLAA